MIKAIAKTNMPPRWGRFGRMKKGDTIRCTMDQLSRTYSIPSSRLNEYFTITRN